MYNFFSFGRREFQKETYEQKDRKLKSVVKAHKLLTDSLLKVSDSRKPLYETPNTNKPHQKSSFPCLKFAPRMTLFRKELDIIPLRSNAKLHKFRDTNSHKNIGGAFKYKANNDKERMYDFFRENGCVALKVISSIEYSEA